MLWKKHALAAVLVHVCTWGKLQCLSNLWRTFTAIWEAVRLAIEGQGYIEFLSFFFAWGFAAMVKRI
jgi:hypothetical protein